MIESKNSILEFRDPLLSLNPPFLTTDSLFIFVYKCFSDRVIFIPVARKKTAFTDVEPMQICAD